MMESLQMLKTGPVQICKHVAANQGHMMQACLRSRKQIFMSRSLMRQAARPSWRTPSNRRGTYLCSHVSAAAAAPAPESLGYRHIMLAIADSKKYLTDASKQAVGAAASLAKTQNGKVTVLLVDVQEPGLEEATTRSEALAWQFREAGFEHFEILSKVAENAAVAVGDAADQVAADLVALHTDSIHQKIFDANLLAEMVPSPMLLLV
eukprot:jgi/Astpho2/4897/Aster-05826